MDFQNFRTYLLKNRWFWLVGIIGLLLDQLSKTIVLRTFTNQGDTFALIPDIFHFTYVINTGAAFSIFTNGVNWLRWLSLGVSLGLMALAWFGDRLQRWEELGYGFILAGAMGNGVDRFLFGHVIDFIDVRVIHFAVFNIADVCINIGIICLLINLVIMSFFNKSDSHNSSN